MKVVILAGGYGTRISEESYLKPKPLIEIGSKPILWHLMKIYSSYGLTDFIICLGYKGYLIKEYFANYSLHMSNVTFDLRNNKVEIHHDFSEPWKITLIDTGENTNTGGRLKQVFKYLENETFCFTYGDGLANINIDKLIKFHNKHKKIATVTAVQPPARYGALIFKNKKVIDFKEKPKGYGEWISGGFFVLEPNVKKYIANKNSIWEKEPLSKLARTDQLQAYFHKGFWRPMDTLRDKIYLEDLWKNKKAPWKIWN